MEWLQKHGSLNRNWLVSANNSSNMAQSNGDIKKAGKPVPKHTRPFKVRPKNAIVTDKKNLGNVTIDNWTAK